MRLKIGELAKRTGMTVRTLHHYDSIGLLTPSARTDSGHRLYIYPDIARLHAIQALRQVGLSLNEIGELLSGEPEPLPVIIQRQIATLESHIKSTSELCARLKSLSSELVDGTVTDTANWFSTLAAMNAYSKYFNAEELKQIGTDWKTMKARWLPLIAAVREAMNAGIPPDSMEVQPLARRWMELMFRWMKGNFDLLERWQTMYLQETAAHGIDGIDLEMTGYIDVAAGLRTEALMRHFSQEELQCFRTDVEAEWNALADKLEKLLLENAPLKGRKVQNAVAEWSDLVDRTVDHDPAMREKLLKAFDSEPILRAGAIITPKLNGFLREALQAGGKPYR